jgi:hypothetical protein
MFRRKSTELLRQMSHAQRLVALGSILDEQRFVLDGLSILASGDGFVVVGYVATMQGFHSQLTERTLEITGPMLEAARGRK